MLSASRLAVVAATAATLLVPGLPALASSAPPAAAHQARRHRVVFELTSAEPASWEALVNNLENLTAHYGSGNVQAEVVAHGQGIGFMLRSNAKLAERLEPLADRGVVFAACNNTMKRKGIAKEALWPFAVVVPAGVAEVIEKQEAGWAYIRSGL